MDELSPKQRILNELKAQAYDQIAIKEQAERTLAAINERILMVDAQPEHNVQNAPLENQPFFPHVANQPETPEPKPPEQQ